MAFNKVILVGNFTADPELKQTPSGESVCSFSIAVNRKMAKNGEVDFFNIQTWRQRAEFVSRYFKKGKPILVCGQIQSRSWTDQQNQKHYATEVVADEVSFVENKGEGTSASSATSYAPDAYSAPSYSTNGAASGFEEVQDDDGLPF
jgi:single-strand DNA-binding protein